MTHQTQELVLRSELCDGGSPSSVDEGVPEELSPRDIVQDAQAAAQKEYEAVDGEIDDGHPKCEESPQRFFKLFFTARTHRGCALRAARALLPA
jgi:hypothetical protein